MGKVAASATKHDVGIGDDGCSSTTEASPSIQISFITRNLEETQRQTAISNTWVLQCIGLETRAWTASIAAQNVKRSIVKAILNQRIFLYRPRIDSIRGKTTGQLVSAPLAIVLALGKGSDLQM